MEHEALCRDVRMWSPPQFWVRWLGESDARRGRGACTGSGTSRGHGRDYPATLGMTQTRRRWWDERWHMVSAKQSGCREMMCWANKQSGVRVRVRVEVLLQSGVVRPRAVQVRRPCCCYSGHFQLLDFGLLKSFCLGTSILEPDLHLQQEGKRIQCHATCITNFVSPNCS
jgi:hypothetical protein